MKCNYLFNSLLDFIVNDGSKGNGGISKFTWGKDGEYRPNWAKASPPPSRHGKAVLWITSCKKPFRKARVKEGPLLFLHSEFLAAIFAFCTRATWYLITSSIPRDLPRDFLVSEFPFRFSASLLFQLSLFCSCSKLNVFPYFLIWK